jgi:hypothetical protein
MSNTSFQSLHQQNLVVDALIVDASNVNVQERFIASLDAIARANLPAPAECVVMGTTPGPSSRQATWQKLGYSARFTERDPGQGEIFVDVTLVAHMQRAILNVPPDQSPSQHLIVLVTGDGNDNDGMPSFKHAVHVALRNGFNVRLVCWHPNSVYRKFAAEFPNQLQIVQIDKDMLELQLKILQIDKDMLEHACAPLGGVAAQRLPPTVAAADDAQQQSRRQSLTDAAHAFLLSRPLPATSANTAVRLSLLGIALTNLGIERVKGVQKCLQADPSRFCLLDTDKPGFAAVYIAQHT